MEGEGVVFEPMQSATIGQLAAALAKAQGMMKNAVKDSENPYFKSSYADLASVWEACREPLSKNELAVIQTTKPLDNAVEILTTLAHSSGEWIRGELRLVPVKGDPQGYGSAITYGRRYGLSAIVGVAPEGEDDDGNAGSHHGSVQPPKPKGNPNMITDSQRAIIYAACKKHGVTPEMAKEYLKEKYQIETAEKIAKKDFNDILKWVVDHQETPDEPGAEG